MLSPSSGLPRSTAVGWLRGEYRPVVTVDILDMDAARLQAEVLKLRRRVRMLGAIVGLLVALTRALGVRLEQSRLPEGAAKARLLRAIDRAQGVRSRSAPHSASWACRRRATIGGVEASESCELDDQVSCPRSSADATDGH